MIETKIGNIDGDSWEELCQQVYKRRYTTYQEMVASPGDWGIEGYVRGEGIAIQCYCPSKLYSANELYQKQVNKITKDLNKLSEYKKELLDRIGTNKDDLIRQWIFITPNYQKNEILKHLLKKEKEVREENLEFISPDFKVLIHTIDDYLEDIVAIQSLKGEKLSLSESYCQTIEKVESHDDYSNNIYRKNRVRCTNNGNYSEIKHAKLNEITKEKFIFGDKLIRNIEITIPEIYQAMAGIINQYESEVEELCCTWFGSHTELIEKIRDQLKQRLVSEDKVKNSISNSDIDEVVDHMISKWIALCPLEVE
ncbi:hypothetical protein [Photobacterium alginatilyticum]|uniref:Uncharacterized protein n=1 Tax=Photobacterium alginatilyticum TaxID=1775171 RepID=A0ABW9YMS2_9GAMM|nr:hypothetical protein [Photobacterium alginatilyticum]NBI54670.1 hypothetical protein [Photobacterium alginatilyticum]